MSYNEGYSDVVDALNDAVGMGYESKYGVPSAATKSSTLPSSLQNEIESVNSQLRKSGESAINALSLSVLNSSGAEFTYDIKMRDLNDLVVSSGRIVVDLTIRAYVAGVGRLLGVENKYCVVVSSSGGKCCPAFSEVIENDDFFSIPEPYGHWGCTCTINVSVEEIPDDEPDMIDNKSTISLGQAGDDVKALQIRLNELGYRDDNGRMLDPDGSFGPRTEQAVNKFKDAVLPGGNQGENRGVVGATTWEYLEKAEPLVSELQRKINEGNLTSLLSRDYPEEPNVDKYLVFNNPGQENIDPVFAMRLAALARDNEIIITINSGFRSSEKNDQVGGSLNSWHMYGEAVDTSSSWLKGVNSKERTEEQSILLEYGLFKPHTQGNRNVGDGRAIVKDKNEDWHIQPIETFDIVDGVKININRSSFYDAYKGK